jgi:hypothetical protein
MHSVDAKISGVRVILSCDASAVSLAKTFLSGLKEMQPQVRDNLTVPHGFSHLVLRKDSAGDLIAHEPNYAGNPVIGLRSDVTTTLALQADMLAVAQKHDLAPHFPHYMDRARVFEGWAHTPAFVLARNGGIWEIGHEGKTSEFGIRLYELLGSRPLLLTAMALPNGTRIRVDGDAFTVLH